MNIVSLFDGMACGYEALERAGIKPGLYYAAEVDKYAMQIAKKNHLGIIHMGDVTRWREWNIDWSKIDLLIGGSPCQGFSFAGKQLAFDDPRSKLFFVYVDILNHIKRLNPNVKFLLENVKMKKEFLAVISEQLGVEPVFINSALVSAQNRQRYYWANWYFGQPEDKGILLKDILKRGAVDREKSYCIDACYYKGGNREQYFNKSRRQLVFDDSVVTQVGNDVVIPRDKSKCVRSSGRGSYDHHEWDSVDDLHYRKLTPMECERLQTLPDNYTEGVSNTQRYKMLGNGWTVDVIAHIFKSMNIEKLPEQQGELF